MDLGDRNTIAIVLELRVIGLSLDDLAAHGIAADGAVVHCVLLIVDNGDGRGSHLRWWHGIGGSRHGRGRVGRSERRRDVCGRERGRVRLLRLGQLLVERLGGVELERERRLVDGDCSGLLAHLLTLQVPLESVEEETVMRNAVPVEDLLFLLGSDAVVLVQEVEERALGLFEGGIGAGLEVTKVREDALLELLRVLHRTSECLESKGEAADDVGARDMEEIIPTGVNNQQSAAASDHDIP